MKVKNLLSLIVIALMIVLSSNKIFAQDLLDDSMKIADYSYNGQIGYGSSGILDCEEYLKDKYNGEVNLVEYNNLELTDVPQIEFSKGSPEGNCCITTIARVIYYYSESGEIQIEDKDVDAIYNVVRDIAIDKYEYPPEGGLYSGYVKPLIEDVFEHYGYNVEVGEEIVYWNFDEHVKNEIDNKKPVILANGLGFGYYSRHALSICGYKTYKVSKRILFWTYNKEYPMIEVCDGWSYRTKYIDYNQFKRELQSWTSMVFTVSIGEPIEEIGGEAWLY